MPMTQTWNGIFAGWSGAGMKRRATRPTAVPIAKVMADSRKGGVLPDASVKSASSAHMATAEKPIRVARAMRIFSGARSSNHSAPTRPLTAAPGP